MKSSTKIQPVGNLARCLPRDRRPEDVIAARRERLASDLRREGANETVIRRLATDEAAASMLDHEERVVGAIATMLFGEKC